MNKRRGVVTDDPKAKRRRRRDTRHKIACNCKPLSPSVNIHVHRDQRSKIKRHEMMSYQVLYS